MKPFRALLGAAESVQRVGNPARRLVAMGVTALVLSASASSRLRADDPPAIEHQPAPCTIPNQAISLCASVSDDGTV
jgi:hypothetical protein